MVSSLISILNEVTDCKYCEVPDDCDMDWASLSIYGGILIILMVGIFIYRGVKKSQANCCGGRCGCAVSKRKKKARGAASSR